MNRHRTYRPPLPPFPADPLRGNPCDPRDPRSHVSPLKGLRGTCAASVSYRALAPVGAGLPSGMEGHHSDAAQPTANYSLLTANSLTYTFSAKEKDVETGLSYFGSRYYSSDLSIWLSVDPMSDKYASLSPYVYCADNPVKLVDPNGEELSNPDDPPKRNFFQKIGDGFVKFDKSLEGHSDGANQASDVPEWVKNGVQAVVSAVPGISEINDAKIVITKKDIYGNEASKADVNIAKASLATGGGLSVAKKGFVAIAKKTNSIATKTKAVAAARFTEASKTVTQGASKIYTAVKLFIKPSDNDEKKTSNKR